VPTHRDHPWERDERANRRRRSLRRPRLVATPAERRLLRFIVIATIVGLGWLAHRGIWFIW
jgi:hypothetical protein